MPNANDTAPTGREVISPADPRQIVDEQYASPASIRERRETPSLGDKIEAAWAENNLFLNMGNLRYEADRYREVDGNFAWNDETLAYVTEGIPQEHLEEFQDARSYAHALYIKDRIQRSLDNKNVLARSGWSGMGLSMLASTLDPATIPVGYAMGGSGVVTGFIGRGSWSVRAGKSALAAASAAGIQESLLMANDRTRDYTDVSTAMLFAAAFGGVLGPLAPRLDKPVIRKAIVETDLPAASQSLIRRITARAFDKAGIPLSRTGRKALGKLDDLAELGPRIRKAVESVDDFAKLSHVHAAVARSMDALSHKNVLGNSGSRVLRRILAHTDGRSLKGVDLRVKTDALVDSKGNIFADAIGMSEGNTISLRASESGIKAKRHLGTLLHEIGHTGFRKLTKEQQQAASNVFSKLRDRKRLRPFVESIAGKDAGRNLSRLEASDSELFAEVFSKNLQSRFGGDDLIAYSKKAARQADNYLNSRLLDAEDRAILDSLTDEIAGVHKQPKSNATAESINASSPEGDPNVVSAAELDTLDFETPERITGWNSLFRKLDLTGYLKTSRIDSIRKAAGLILYDSVGDYNGRVRVESLEEFIDRRMSAHMGNIYSVVNAEFSGWARKQPGRFARFSDSARADFMEKVGSVMHLNEIPSDLDPHVKKVLEAYQGGMRDALQEAADHGVPGAKELLSAGDAHRPRLMSDSKRLLAYDKHGRQAVIDWFEGSIMSKSKKLNPNSVDDARLAKQMARGYVLRREKIARERGLSMAGGVAHTAEEVEELLNLFNVEGKLTDADLAKAREIITTGDDGKPSIFRARMPLDEDFVLHIKDDGSSLSFADLFETNAEKLSNHYIQSAVRATGDWNVRRRLFDPSKDIRKAAVEGTDAPLFGQELKEVEQVMPPTFDQYIQRARKELDGLSGKELKAEQRKLSLLEIGYRQTMGLEINDGLWQQIGRMAMKLNFARIGGRFGIAQLGEVPAAVGANGIGVMLDSIPDLRKIVKGGPKLLREDEGLLSELVAMGIGTEGWSRPSRVISEMAGDIAWDRANLSKLDKAERLLDKAGKATAIASGMQGITNWSRVAYANGLAQRFANLALRDGKKISIQRLADMGLSPEDAEAIFEQIRKHSTVEEGQFSVKMRRANIDQWDADASAKFAKAITQASNSAIQKNHLGSLPPYAHSPVLRVLTQFRSFVLASTGNHLLRGLRLRDADVFQSWALHLLGGTLSYTILQASKAATSENGAEEFANNMRMDRLVLGAFSRSAPAAIIPGVADTALSTFTNYRLFSHARSSGLSQDFIKGNPTVDLFNDISRTLSIGSSLRSDYDLSQEDVNAFRSLVPLNNLIGIDHTLKAIEQQLPRKSQKRDAENDISSVLFGKPEDD